MRKIIIVTIIFLLTSCSTTKNVQQPFPKDFDEAELWMDSMFNIPIVIK